MYQFDVYSECNRKPNFDVILGGYVANIQMMSRVETSGKSTIVVARYNFHFVLEVMIYHHCEPRKYCNKRIFSLATFEALQHGATFFALFV